MLTGYKLIENYLENVVFDLSDKAPYSSGSLKDGISYNFEENDSGWSIDITMPAHGFYLDKGVSGKKRKFNSPYSYTNKMPPPSSLDGWIVRSGLAPRDAGGKLMKRKQMQFMLAKSIFDKGIAPRNWIEPVLDKHLNNIADLTVDELWNAFRKRMEKFNYE